MIKLLQSKLKDEIKSGNKKNVIAYRNMIGKLKSQEIDSKSELTDDMCINILQKMAKQINDSIMQFKDGGRLDLVESEQNELDLIQSFLPKQLSSIEMKNIISEIINDNDANGISDLGKIMGLVMNKIQGKGDGKLASKIVKELLTQ
ncbi:MAG: glutamyl-tRNA amidotransferase [Candidatus Marinimicrobia bacterium]|nr:glutamyl-tRNA amidotransferase [Candidatus Neomarinimicrobiota bacterium]